LPSEGGEQRESQGTFTTSRITPDRYVEMEAPVEQPQLPGAPEAYVSLVQRCLLFRAKAGCQIRLGGPWRLIFLLSTNQAIQQPGTNFMRGLSDHPDRERIPWYIIQSGTFTPTASLLFRSSATGSRFRLSCQERPGMDLGLHPTWEHICTQAYWSFDCSKFLELECVSGTSQGLLFCLAHWSMSATTCLAH